MSRWVRYEQESSSLRPLFYCRQIDYDDRFDVAVPCVKRELVLWQIFRGNFGVFNSDGSTPHPLVLNSSLR
jgi:hypothetical protein